ncbi:MAG: hypothetical protein OXF64_06160 [bacterium]|nr:hypothetical protein [bacterium]
MAAAILSEAIGTSAALTGIRVPHLAKREENPMPVSEIQRTELVNRLVNAIGEESTETLMQCILPDGRDQLATKEDLKAVEAGLRMESADVRGAFAKLRSEFAELKGEFAELKGEFAELKGEFAELRAEFAELRAYIDSSLAKQTRLNVMMFASFLVANWGVMLPFLIAS